MARKKKHKGSRVAVSVLSLTACIVGAVMYVLTSVDYQGVLQKAESPIEKTETSAQKAETRAADVAVITISRQAGEGGDRHLEDDFLLSNLERRMLADVCEVFHGQGKKVIVVLNVGGVVETASWKDLPDAIVLAWQPGQEGGNALADILSGKVCPSGRLPVTFPSDYFDLPSSAHFPYDFTGRSSMTGGRDRDSDVENVGYTVYSEGTDVGYRHFLKPDTPEVSFPFGYGLSYTTFWQSDPVIEGGVVKVTVKNTGAVPGKQVVMFMDPVLRAFGKTRLLGPGEYQTLVLPLISAE